MNFEIHYISTWGKMTKQNVYSFLLQQFFTIMIFPSFSFIVLCMIYTVYVYNDEPTAYTLYTSFGGNSNTNNNPLYNPFRCILSLYLWLYSKAWGEGGVPCSSPPRNAFVYCFVFITGTYVFLYITVLKIINIKI